LKYVLCVLIGYLIGVINPSYIIAKSHGFDIRKKGSGNAGASNALILFGKVLGIGCALLDIAKATFAIWLSEKLFPGLAYSLAATGVACIIGHVFPFYMNFRGGKGLACLGGMILAFDWRVFLIMLTAEVLVVIITDYICFVPITASLAFPIIYGIMRHDLYGALFLAIIFPLMLFKHKENLKRIKQNTEMPFSFLWNKDKALAKTNIAKR